MVQLAGGLLSMHDGAQHQLYLTTPGTAKDTSTFNNVFYQAQ